MIRNRAQRDSIDSLGGAEKELMIARVLNVDDSMLNGLELIWNTRRPSTHKVYISHGITLQKTQYHSNGNYIDVFIIKLQSKVNSDLNLEFYHKKHLDVATLKKKGNIEYNKIPDVVKTNLRRKWNTESRINNLKT